MSEPTYCPDTDDALMRRVTDTGDTGAFRCVVRRHQARLIAFAARMFGGDLDAGADVAQETFVRLWETRALYVPQNRLLPYLLRIAHNLCLSRLRSPASKVQSLEGLAETTCADASDTALAVRDALFALPIEQRVVFLLSEYTGLTYVEIATTLGIAEGTVASRKHAAIRALRVSLDAWKGETS